jgi:putative oxidoreductase
MVSAFSRYQHVAGLVLRVAIAAVFLYHGSMKWSMWGQPGFGGMAALMKILSILEPLFAIAVLVGFLTRWSALALGIVMIGSIETKIATWHMGFSMAQGTGWEFDLMVLAGCVAVLCYGPGRLSVDAALHNDA